MDDPVEPISGPHFYQRVDVVGHHAPSRQRIALSIKVQKGYLNQRSDGRSRQIALAIPLVGRRIDRENAVVLPHLDGVFTDFSWKAICQAEDDMLKDVRRVQM